MGRTKKIHDLYDNFIQFRISRSQYYFLCQYCDSLNMSISTYFRKYIDSLMACSGDLISNYLSNLLSDTSFSQEDKYYIRKTLEVLKKYRKVG